MCDRYSFGLSREKTARRFQVKLTQAPEANYNISPGSIVPVILSHPGRQLALYRWGLEGPLSVKKKNTPLIHAVSTATLTKQPYLHQLLKMQRCLIPADGFYLWQRISRKSQVPYRVVLKWNMPFAFAGIYDGIPAGNDNLISSPAFGLFTTDANDLTRKIQTLMPVILPLEAEEEWLNPELSVEQAIGMLKPYPPDKMNCFPVSTQINNPSFNSPALLQPVQATDQFGNYILFER